jgi:hypothetical protein
LEFIDTYHVVVIQLTPAVRQALAAWLEIEEGVNG